jgi:hypothetical protein
VNAYFLPSHHIHPIPVVNLVTMPTMPTIEGVSKWHRTYDDPKDDVVLISSEGTGFRVSSRLISKHR